MKIISADLLDQTGIIAHQVNSLGVMGRGLALQIRTRWPVAYQAYRKWCKSGKRLGKTLVVQTEPDLMIANVCAQEVWGHGRQTDYEALDRALANLATQVLDGTPVYFPYWMGCGLAGGSWNKVLPIIARHFPDAIICRVGWAEGSRYADGNRDGGGDGDLSDLWD